MAPATPKKSSNKVILWVALGCGGFLFIAVVAAVAVPLLIAHFAKQKIAEEVSKQNPALGQAIQKGGITGGITAGGGQMVAAGASIYGSMVLVPLLPEGERKGHMATLERLTKVGPQFTTDDIEAVTKAMETIQKAHTDKSQPTADEARAFMEAVAPIAEKYQPQ